MQRFPAKDGAARVSGMIVNDPLSIDVSNSSFFMNKLGLLAGNPNATDKSKVTVYLKKLMEEC